MSGTNSTSGQVDVKAFNHGWRRHLYGVALIALGLTFALAVMVLA
jgi:hypothetical protein